jgi:DNA repair exonuclease SbcCD nuclease subunit
MSDLILTADWHLREDTPACRTDDYWVAQEKAVDFVTDLAREHQCPVIIAGDVFDRWRRTHRLVSWAAEHMPEIVYAIPGQHDLPNHQLSEAPKSALYVLEATNRLFTLTPAGKSVTGAHRAPNMVIYGYPYGAKLQKAPKKTKTRQIAVCHTMVWHREKPWPGCEADSALKLLKKMQGFDLIVTGDNHKPFTVRTKSGRLLVNPGSLLRMRADQAEHLPRVYLYDAEENTVKPVYLPIDKKAVSRTHIDISERKEERQERYSSFVKRLGGKWEVGLSFEDNLKKFFRKHKTKKAVKRLVLEALEK